jgi:protein-tyrosine phosphatase
MERNKEMPKEYPHFWYTLVEGIIISEYPSDRKENDPRRLQAKLDRGCTAFLDLTESDEWWDAGRCPLHPYESLLHDLATQSRLDVVYARYPVRDLSIPTMEQMQHMLDTIDGWRSKGYQVLIHCLGGIGRSGTVAACYLVRHGWSPDQALRHIQQQLQASTKRGRMSPETSAQIEFVHTWATFAQKSTEQGATK